MLRKNYKKYQSTFFLCLLILSSIVSLSACTNQTNEEIRNNFQEVVDQMNQSTPMQIDKYTVLEKLALGEDLHIIYYYILDEQAILAENVAEPFEVAEKMYDLFVPRLCSNEEIRPILAADANFEFIFNNQMRTELARFSIVEKNCTLLSN